MISCPKCRSIRINGPKYRKSGFGREALLYTCMQCGYEDEEACADADMKSSGRPPPMDHRTVWQRMTGARHESISGTRPA